MAAPRPNRAPSGTTTGARERGQADWTRYLDEFEPVATLSASPASARRTAQLDVPLAPLPDRRHVGLRGPADQPDALQPVAQPARNLADPFGRHRRLVEAWGAELRIEIVDR